MSAVPVTIEYCSSCGFRPKAEDLRRAIEEQCGRVFVDLKPGRAGSFEVTAGDRLLHSRLDSGKWPDQNEIIREVSAMGSKNQADFISVPVIPPTDSSATTAFSPSQPFLTPGIPPAGASAMAPPTPSPTPILNPTNYPLSSPYSSASPTTYPVSGAHISANPTTYPVSSPYSSTTDPAGATVTTFPTDPAAYAAPAPVSVSYSSPPVAAVPSALPPPPDPPGQPSSKMRRLPTSQMMPEPVIPLTGPNAKETRNQSVPRRLFRWPLWLRFPLFWYPYNIDNNHSRLISFCVFISALFLCIFASKAWAKFYLSFVFVDYIVRILYGGRASVFGAGTYWIAYYLPTVPYPGPPKQFAQIIGALFAGGALLALWLDENGHSNLIAARVLLALLAAATFLDSILNFCLGCLTFRLFTRCLPASVDPSIKCDLVVDELIIQSEYEKTRYSGPEPTTVIMHPSDSVGDRQLPLIYRTKREESKKDDFSPIRHVDPSYFWWAVGTIGIAACFRVANISPLNTHRSFWIVLVIFGAVVFCLILLLHILQFFIYPYRTAKHWDNPVLANSLAALPLSVALLAFILYDEWDDRDFVKFLFWFSAISSMLLTCAVVSRWIRRPLHRTFLGPDWMAVPVSNLVVAAAGPLIDDSYREVSFLWFSVGLIFWIVLLTSSFIRLSTSNYTTDMHRPYVWIWLAAPAVAFVAYQRLLSLILPDAFALILFYFSVGMFLILICLIPMSYFGRNRFDTSYWGYVFPIEAFCIAWIVYYSLHQTKGTHFLAIASLCLAIYVCASVLAHTISAVLTRTMVFVVHETSPIQLVNEFHYAFRTALQKMNRLLLRLDDSVKLREFATLWAQYSITLDMHSRFEDTKFFPLLEEYYPGLTTMAMRQHDDLHALHAQLDGILLQVIPESRAQVRRRANLPAEDVLPAPGAASLQQNLDTIRRIFPEIIEVDTAHISWEEMYIRPVLAKTLNYKLMKELIRSMWQMESVNSWRVALPFVVNNAEPHFRRLQFLRSLAGVMPERIQLIGQLIYEGVDPMMWNRISVDVPEMIPRNVDYYSKYY